MVNSASQVSALENISFVWLVRKSMEDPNRIGFDTLIWETQIDI